MFSIPSASMENTLRRATGSWSTGSSTTSAASTAVTSWCSAATGRGTARAAPPGNPVERGWEDVTNLVGFSAPGTDYVKRVIGLPGTTWNAATPGPVTVNGVPLNEKSTSYPGDHPNSDAGSTSGPARAAVGDGRPPVGLGRLPLPHGGRGRRHDPGERGRRPGVRDHLAAVADRRPADPATFQQAALHAAAAVVGSTPALGTTTAAIAAGALAWLRRRRLSRPHPPPPTACSPRPPAPRPPRLPAPPRYSPNART